MTRGLKIIQVATLITPNGAYGGPVRVAVNQTRALLEAGHEVKFLAGAQGFSGDLPTHFDGVPVELFAARQIIPRCGFAGTFAPGLLRHLRKLATWADVLHVHLARDLVTLPAANMARNLGLPYVVQPHGMIQPSNNPLSTPLDLSWTKPVLSSASSVLHLTGDELAGLRNVTRKPLAYKELRNGVPLSGGSAVLPEPAHQEVLFLARLHPVKRPLAFVQMSLILAQEFPGVSFRLVGPDEGEGNRCTEAMGEYGQADLKWEGAIAPERTLGRLSASSIYVLPSAREVFPMSVLEAMSLGKPVVITRTCGLAPAVERAHAGLVVDGSVESLVQAVRKLLSEPGTRLRMGKNAQRLALEEFGMTGVVSELESTYRKAVSKSRRSVA
ncbi:glycosyltransferase [Arthrobacter globiformis]|uniref:Glycosyltransferase n=1 Tax=Arthrobacter globiformis TaxID=1665 RepID=A0A328HIC6_ARTGO|nr:glycosyltransferase [Arthrobacter globiformis]RAM36980.1 glycosyltransferase [Arthrobacter globiformis]